MLTHRMARSLQGHHQMLTTKQSFLKEVIENNYSITETIDKIRKLNNSELLEITNKDIIEFDYHELVLKLPDEKYIKYCDDLCTDDYIIEQAICYYYNTSWENNEFVTFTNLLSYYIKFVKYPNNDE